MKIIAFFNLKNKKDEKEFLKWVIERQTKVFQNKLKKMKDFKVCRLFDADNYKDLPQMVQIFDWDGTPEEWRETLVWMRDPLNEEIYKITQEWLEYCDSDSTQILYAEKDN